MEARPFRTVGTERSGPAQGSTAAPPAMHRDAAGQRRKIPKETPKVNTMDAWTRVSPPKPMPRVGIVLFSSSYILFTGKGAPRTTLGAPLFWRERTGHPRPRRRYYPAQRKVRGEEGPAFFYLKNKNFFAFRYANPIQTPYRR